MAAAVRERYLTPPSSRREIVQEIFRLEIPIEEDWNSIEEEIARAHAESLRFRATHRGEDGR